MVLLELWCLPLHFEMTRSPAHLIVQKNKYIISKGNNGNMNKILITGQKSSSLFIGADGILMIMNKTAKLPYTLPAKVTFNY